jgi:hypothetical protein
LDFADWHLLSYGCVRVRSFNSTGEIVERSAPSVFGVRLRGMQGACDDASQGRLECSFRYPILASVLPVRSPVPLWQRLLLSCTATYFRSKSRFWTFGCQSCRHLSTQPNSVLCFLEQSENRCATISNRTVAGSDWHNMLHALGYTISVAVTMVRAAAGSTDALPHAARLILIFVT